MGRRQTTDHSPPVEAVPSELVPLLFAPTQGRKWTVTYKARPISLNASYGHHRKERTAHVIEWRNTFWALAKESKVPRLEAITVTVVTKLNGPMQDIGNDYVSAKAAIDGLVQAGVIANDTGDHLRALTFLPPTRVPPSEPCSLSLIITEVNDGHPVNP